VSEVINYFIVASTPPSSITVYEAMTSHSRELTYLIIPWYVSHHLLAIKCYHIGKTFAIGQLPSAESSLPTVFMMFDLVH